MINYQIIVNALLSTLEPSEADIAISCIASELSAAGELLDIAQIIIELRKSNAAALADELQKQLL